MNTSPWNKFSQINGLSGGGEEKQKCATPIIVYQNGELTFSCETEGVEYVYDVKINDSKAGKGDKVQLMPKYSINVYATKADRQSPCTSRVVPLKGIASLLEGDSKSICR